MNTRIKSALWAIIVITLAVASYSALRMRNSFASKDLGYNLLQRNISLTASDSRTLDAAITVPVPVDSTTKSRLYPGVILLSPYLESGQVYGHLPGMLAEKGIVVLTVNMRYSLGVDSTAVMAPEDIANLPLDAEAAISYLSQSPYVTPKRIGILGTGLSARAALIGANNQQNIKCAALISATLDEQGMDAIKNMPFRPILVLVSIADGPAGNQAKDILAASAHPESKLESFFGAGEGSEIWYAPTSTEMALLIVDWMKQQLSTH